MSCPNGFSVTLHNYYEGTWRAYGIAYKQRRIIGTGGTVLSWEEDYFSELDEEQIFTSLDAWHDNCYTYSECNKNTEDNPDYFTVSPSVRANCFSQAPSSSTPLINGRSSPPPKRKKEMCCPCDVIATMIERNMAEKARQSELIKNHIDQRFLEALKNINQQLGAIQIDLDLDPVIQEIRQVRTDLWNGVGGKD